jgi:two-component system sensor histidine kinase AtoS
MYLALFWPKLIGHLNSAEVAFVLLSIVVVSFLIPLTRDTAERILDKYVYRTRVDYRKIVREASRQLTRVLDSNRLQRFILSVVRASTPVEGAAIYIRNDSGVFERAVSEEHEGAGFSSPAQISNVTINELLRTRDGILLDDLAREGQSQYCSAVFALLASFNWSLLLPLLSEDVVIGVIVVGPKLSGDPFYPQDLDLLMTLANQAGIALKNAQLYGQVVLANEHIENIVATIDSGVVAVNALGYVTMFNRAAELLTGMAPDRVRGAHVSVLPACLSETLLGTIRERAKQTLPEIDLPDGNVTRPVICTTSLLRDPAGTPLGAVAVFSDLTPLKELERQRRRAERLAYFEVLASAIAHEIKNPLVAIKAFAQLVPRRRDNEAFVENFGRVVTREIGRMERLVERLRTLSRPGNRPHHTLDVRVPVTEAVEFLQPSLEQKRITVSVALGDEPRLVQGDDSELGELFLNLLMNAEEATPLDGRLTIDLTATQTEVTITLADTGPGIPDELLERIFEPFVTTKQQGSGLGLAICMGIAEAHDAKLRVANQPTGGAVFAVEFPIAVAATVGTTT